jgi:hypothetical protein
MVINLSVVVTSSVGFLAQLQWVAIRTLTSPELPVSCIEGYSLGFFEGSSIEWAAALFCLLIVRDVTISGSGSHPTTSGHSKIIQVRMPPPGRRVYRNICAVFNAAQA